MEITEVPVEGFERVLRARDRALGLVAYIAIHDTTLGPALGGLRMWSFPDEHTALTDVLRLAEGMTWKNAVAETGMGGGKAVLIGDPATGKSEALFLAVGDFVESLGGRYITAEDVGTTTEDMKIIRSRTKHVTGLPRSMGSSGNPSPFTAHGVYLGVLKTAERAFGLRNASGQSMSVGTPPGYGVPEARGDSGAKPLAGVRVAVQGLGSVGRQLVGHLLRAGAEVIASDLNRDRVADFMETHPEVRWVGHEEIYDVTAEIFSPNALGGSLNPNTIPKLKVKAVAGAANNQLLSESDGELLRARGILYAPDFVINAGGVINIAVELAPGGYSEEAAMRRVEAIPRALDQVFDLARERNWPTSRAAVHLAKERLAEARGARKQASLENRERGKGRCG